MPLKYSGSSNDFLKSGDTVPLSLPRASLATNCLEALKLPAQRGSHIANPTPHCRTMNFFRLHIVEDSENAVNFAIELVTRESTLLPM